jgi:hypothetical protein
MERPTRRDERGLVGVVLTIVIVFALIAVVELTRTLEAAQQIDSTVVGIKGSVNSIGGHLNTGCNTATNAGCTSDALPVLNGTIDLVKQIDAAAKPLTGEAAQIITAATSIDATGKTILASASSINGTVHSIGSLVGSIGGSVNSINASLSAVNADVTVIKAGLIRANGQADTIASFVNGIKADTATINGQAGGILTQAHDISCDPSALIHLSATC